jgi:dTDP-4-amino-4,6-dideoxygalactose transaminase
MIPFNDLKPLHASLAAEAAAAVQRVLASGWYTLGPEVEAFERAFAAYHDVPHAVAVANGTDAIELALRAAGVGPGDEVLTVAHTAVATVCAIERAGARPVLVDIDERSFTMDPEAASAAVTPRTRALVPVHLYGHPAPLHALSRLAGQHNLLLIEDCAQAHGARHDGRPVGTVGHLGAFSFYPTKNLGAYGDGGCVLTRDARLAERLRSLRNYGQTVRYHHGERGVNSRLDELQAALLRMKLRYLDWHNDARRALAMVYRQHLRGVAMPSEVQDDAPIHHVYHLYVVRHPRRDRLREDLERRGVGTLIHYPVPVHLQPAFRDLNYKPGSLPVTERLAAEIVSLPLYPGLSPQSAARVADEIEASLSAAPARPDAA